MYLGGMCHEGSFCPSGSNQPIPCKQGFYCNETKLSNATSKCPPGYYCDGGTPKKYHQICPPGTYCEEGSEIPTKCPMGTFANGTGNQANSSCIDCKLLSLDCVRLIVIG